MSTTIVQDSIGQDHDNMLLSSPPSMTPSKIVSYLKRRSSRLLQDEFLELKKILGIALMDQRLLLLNRRKCDRGNY